MISDVWRSVELGKHSGIIKAERYIYSHQHPAYFGRATLTPAWLLNWPQTSQLNICHIFHYEIYNMRPGSELFVKQDSDNINLPNLQQLVSSALRIVADIHLKIVLFI